MRPSDSSLIFSYGNTEGRIRDQAVKRAIRHFGQRLARISVDHRNAVMSRIVIISNLIDCHLKLTILPDAPITLHDVAGFKDLHELRSLGPLEVGDVDISCDSHHWGYRRAALPYAPRIPS